MRKILPTFFKKNKVLLVLVLALFLFFIFLRWNSFNMPFERDEGVYAYSAWLLSQNIPPYTHSVDLKLPMIIYTYLLAGLINWGVYWSPRLLASIFILGAAILAGLVAGKEFGKRAGWAAVWLSLPMIMFPFLTLAANTEVFMIFPLMGTLALYIWKKGKADKKYWFWAGVFGALALLYKPIALFVLLFIFTVWAIDTWKEQKKLKILIENISFAALGVSLAVFLNLAYFIWQGAMYDLWESTVIFNKYYAQNFGLTLRPFFGHLKLFFFNWWILFVLLGWFVFRRPKRWWFYLGLLLFSLAAIFPTPYGHYYILLMPFWAIITAISIDSLADFVLKRRDFFSFLKVRFFQNKSFLTVFISFIVILLMMWPVRKIYTLSPDELSWWNYSRYNPFVESMVVAKRVKELTAPDDYVFVAGSEPQILYYAKRKSSSRFITIYQLMMRTPLALKYQKEAVLELEDRPPEVIVFARSKLSWLQNRDTPPLFVNYLDRLLNEKYNLVGGFVLDKNGGNWREPISKDQISNSSFLVFKKK